ncbi:MAG: DUF4419 domain-containing protein [bacterium]|nr:DUF4419 domain-containing protein [bacterium]
MNLLPRLLILVLLPFFDGFSQEEGFTFVVDDVEQSTNRLNETTFDVFIKDRFSKKVYAYPQEMSGKKVVAHHGNGFLKTVQFAFNDHRPLELSPDDIWLVICQSFGDHITANKDSMEYLLLKEDHPKEIVVRNDKLTHEDDKEWSNLMASFDDEIDEISKDAFKNLIVQEFSTTTPTISSVYRATRMDVTSHYVGLISKTMCGFPSITLLGTPEDWRKIYHQMDRFSAFGLEHWVEELKPVLEEFVEASEGNPNIDFWKRFYKTITVYDVDVISGWILKFYPYLRETVRGDDSYYPNPFMEGQKYLLSDIGDESLPKGRKETEFKWICYRDSIFTEKLRLYSGFYGILQDETTGAVRPNISWVITSAEVKGSSGSNYKIYRQDRQSREDRYKECPQWEPGLTGRAKVKPIYNEEEHGTFEEGILTLQKKMVHSGLFKKDDHPKIQIWIAHEGTLIIQSIEGASDKQEEYIRNLLDGTSGLWKPALHPHVTPVNFSFVLTI